VVAPDVQSEVDVLERDGRPPLLSVPTPVRRALLAVLALAVVAGWLVDRHLQDEESAALGACAATSLAAVDAALGPVRSMSEYVRPTLAGTPPGELRRGLYDVVAGAARGPRDDLRAALASCREVPVLTLHANLRDRRASCERLVRQTIDYLGRVALDGRAVFRSSAGTEGSAAGCAG
jgi:hypothetical protein